jgi:hypothetical protein
VPRAVDAVAMVKHGTGYYVCGGGVFRLFVHRSSVFEEKSNKFTWTKAVQVEIYFLGENE